MIQNNTKQWINTRVEYQWSDELAELVQVSKEGYWYEGEMTLCAMTTRTNDDSGWAFRDHNTYGSDVNMYYCHGGGYGMSISASDASENTYIFETYGQGSGEDQHFIIKGNGNVGIGTGVPDTRLNIHSNSEAWMRINSDFDNNSGDTDCGIYFSVDSAVAKGIILYDQGLDAFCLGYGSDKDIAIRSSGNVGIGETAPDTLLHLKHASDYSPEIKIEHTGGSNNGGLLIKSTGAAANADRLGHIQFDGLNNNSENIRYAEIGSYIDDVADGSEDGKITFSTYVAGTHAERMTIKTGNVGIGAASPSYKLEVTGTFYSSGSSIEYKEDVEPYTPPEGALMSLKPVQYDYKDEWKDFGKRYAGNSSKQLGFVAEDVAKILPELAVTKTEDGEEVVRNVDYEKLTVLLVSEVQKLRTELDEIKNY